MSLTPKNWNEFQHYKDRSPIWIKLHRKLLDDFTFSRLPVASRALAPMLWLLASEYDDGKITATNEEMAFRFRMTDADMVEAINPLIDAGFFIADSKPLARRKRVAMPEKRREETQDKTETEGEEKESSLRSVDDFPADAFDLFWKAYPHKIGKAAALKAFKAARKTGVAWATLIIAVNRYIADKPPDRAWCNPATWLNGGRWDDQPAPHVITNGHAPRPGSKDDTRERTVNALRSLDPFPRADEPGSGEGACSPIPRQLSFVKPA